MRNSITQQAVKLIEDIFKTIENIGSSNVEDVTDELFDVLKNGALELVSAAICEMDNAVLAAKKERKLDGLTVKERNVPRTFTTSIGELRYQRTYFSCKDGSNAYITDHLIGIESNERLSKSLCSKLVQYSASMSMHGQFRHAFSHRLRVRSP